MAKKKSASSKRWLDEHSNDYYVQAARKANKRSRSHYKLTEIQEKTKLLQSGMQVLDLGAAPGSWSIYASECVGSHGKVVSCDLLDIKPYKNLITIKGDFNAESTQNAITSEINHIDVIMSDIAPNTTGIAHVDQLAFYNLADSILTFSQKYLAPDGSLLIKLFHGIGFDEYLQTVRSNFVSIKILKPKASRARSTECYLLAKKLK